ncbi:hypothetical protein [Celerinatantimonas yamalensis]|uniref:Flagellar hook-length control protein FliK n=1 Tax=Celerinatantimonas yamalensis TaxID=559956 RepID=A0ABW9G632_9GAMM
MKITPAVTPPAPPIATVPPMTKAGTLPDVANPSSQNNSLSIISLLSTFLDQSISLTTLSNTQQAPLSAGIVQQLLNLFKTWEKQLSAPQIKTLLNQFLQFKPLDQTQPTPLATPLNQLLSAFIAARLSPKAAEQLKAQFKLQDALIKELAPGSVQHKAVGELLKHLNGQTLAAQLASHDGKQQLNVPLFIHLPIPIDQQLRRVEARISKESHHNETSRDCWHLKMLLPVGENTHVLADIRLEFEQPAQIQFYCPDHYWLSQVQHHTQALQQRLAELGIPPLQLNSQLGHIPTTLLPKHKGQLDIKV